MTQKTRDALEAFKAENEVATGNNTPSSIAEELTASITESYIYGLEDAFNFITYDYLYDDVVPNCYKKEWNLENYHESIYEKISEAVYCILLTIPHWLGTWTIPSERMSGCVSLHPTLKKIIEIVVNENYFVLYGRFSNELAETLFPRPNNQ